MHFSKTALLLLVAGLALGCEDKSSGGDTKSGGSTTATTKSGGTDKPTETAKAKETAPDGNAFFMGRKYAFACSYVMLGEDEQAKKTHGEATTYGSAIGVTPPALPAKDGAIKAMRDPVPAEDIKKKHGDKAAAAYLLGAALTDAFFGANLEADIGPPLADVEKNAKAAGVPETVWKEKLDAVKAKPDADGVTALARAFEAHYKS